MYRTLHIAFFIITALFLSFNEKKEVNPIKILTHMNDSIKNVKTLRVKIYALERIEGKFLTANSEIKLQTSPRRLYFVNKIRKLEVLYNQGELNNKALVKPHVFPYITMSLDPSGNLMRKNQHYTIHELGYDFIGRSVAFTLNKDKEGMKNFSYHGKVIKNGYHCYYLEYENKNYTYINYTVLAKETVSSIASKNGVNDYLIRYKNELLNDFGYLKEGSVIKLPTLYCKKAIILIDEKLMLPVALSLYDDAGIFESYEFTGIQINKPIVNDEFSRQYKDYHF